MFVYRLYTEAKNVDRLHELIGEDFKGYTAIKSLGVYNGKVEDSIVFEIVDDSLGTLSVLAAISEIIRRENNQECVLVTRNEIESFTF